MEGKVNLVMPMGGKGTRFHNNQYILPKPMLEIAGKPFFYWSTQAIKKFVDLESLTFVILQEHVDQFGIDVCINRYFDGARLVIIPDVLNGAVLTCRAGVAHISNELPVIFNDCDHTFLCNALYEFCRKGQFDVPDGALLSFYSDNPQFSYLLADSKARVKKTVEKEVISEHAICGAYYFKNKNVFESASDKYLEDCKYSEYFMSGVFNSMIKEDLFVSYFEVDHHLPFGTPQEYELAKESSLFEKVG